MFLLRDGRYRTTHNVTYSMIVPVVCPFFFSNIHPATSPPSVRFFAIRSCCQITFCLYPFCSQTFCHITSVRTLFCHTSVLSCHISCTLSCLTLRAIKACLIKSSTWYVTLTVLVLHNSCDITSVGRYPFLLHACSCHCGIKIKCVYSICNTETL